MSLMVELRILHTRVLGERLEILQSRQRTDEVRYEEWTEWQDVPRVWENTISYNSQRKNP
jgi:hypothetical protein